MDLFFILLVFALGAVAIVITLTFTVLLLLSNISKLEAELERNQPPF